MADGISIYDLREIARHVVYRLTGLRAEIYRACRSVSNKKALVQKFRDEEKVSETLEYLCAENLILNIGADYLALAIDWRVAKGRT